MNLRGDWVDYDATQGNRTDPADQILDDVQ